jgi:hypothetical protein
MANLLYGLYFIAFTTFDYTHTHFRLLILPFDTMQPALLAAPSNKPQMNKQNKAARTLSLER